MTEPISTSVGWVPLFGEFESTGDEIQFKGRKIIFPASGTPPGAATKEQPMLGLLLSGRTLADGNVSANIIFANVSPETSCEFIVSYDPNASHIVSAGFGGVFGTLFSIREYGGPKTAPQDWFNYRALGDRSMLVPGREFHLEAIFRGARVDLLIDGVLVSSADVSSPLGRNRQVGLLFRGDHLITVKNIKIDALKPRAFVVMQYGNEFDDVYKDVVKEVCINYEVNVLRADEISGPGLIISDIVREISAAQLIIADISSPANANVFFEVGYGLALAKPTIMLAKKNTPLPFDISGFRVLFYEDTIGGKNKLEEGLRRHLDAILTR